MAQDTKDQAKELQDRINDNMDSFEREKKKTKELIQRVKDFLMGECSAAACLEVQSFGQYTHGEVHMMLYF